MNDKPSFFAELKRRNVYKVAVSYAVVGWLLAQIVTQLFPFFEIPNWAVRLIVLAIVIGFPIALFMAWAFELVPEGIKGMGDVEPIDARSHDGEQAGQRTAEQRRANSSAWIYIVIVGGLLSAGLFLLGRYGFQEKNSANALSAKSIAVLPFENLSRDPDNAYFAIGIQDEILTRLSKIADLKVISRTSTQRYKSAPENLPEIARQLNVAHILEGSVQKSGDHVRVNVQLIKASNDSHLWADTFDRKLTDLFSVESEVATAIADQLQARLTGEEKQVIAAKPTDNPLAYDAYLRGLAYVNKTEFTSEHVLPARDYFTQAVRLDPKFALAWAALARINSEGYELGALAKTAAIREEARQAAETALTLQPNLGEALIATALYHSNCLKDYDVAERYLERARPFLPNNSQIPRVLAGILRQRGEWERSESYYGEAERLDPRNPRLLFLHAGSLTFQRRFVEAHQKYEEVLQIIPDDIITRVQEAGIAQAQGDLPRAAALLKPLPLSNKHVLYIQCYQALLERNPAQIIAQIKEKLTLDTSLAIDDRAEMRFWLGWAQEVMGDHATARENWSQARSELEPMMKEQPENYFLITDLASLSAALGDKTAAFHFAEQGMRIVPVEKSALFGLMMIEVLARVAALTGEPDRAIASLQTLLSKPYAGPRPSNPPLTKALLRLDPMFDPLRNNPRFQELCQETPH